MPGAVQGQVINVIDVDKVHMYGIWGNARLAMWIQVYMMFGMSSLSSSQKFIGSQEGGWRGSDTGGSALSDLTVEDTVSAQFLLIQISTFDKSQFPWLLTFLVIEAPHLLSLSFPLFMHIKTRQETAWIWQQLLVLLGPLCTLCSQAVTWYNTSWHQNSTRLSLPN